MISNSESEQGNDDSVNLAHYVDSDNFEEEFKMCPMCNKGDQHPSRWVRCEMYATRWHFVYANRMEYELLDDGEKES